MKNLLFIMERLPVCRKQVHQMKLNSWSLNAVCSIEMTNKVRKLEQSTLQEVAWAARGIMRLTYCIKQMSKPQCHAPDPGDTNEDNEENRKKTMSLSYNINPAKPTTRIWNMWYVVVMQSSARWRSRTFSISAFQLLAAVISSAITSQQLAPPGSSKL